MAIPNMTEDLKIIQGLSDLPNSEDGLTADELKEKFDHAALAIQTYINTILIPGLTAAQIPFSKTTAIDADTIQAAIENVQAQVRDAATGTIVNGSVTKEKLASGLLARIYGGLPWVSLDTPDSGDTPDQDFPIGQVWLRPGFTVVNEAGETWTGSGCTVNKSGNNVVITGSAQAASVTAAQTLNGLGEQGDRVLILFQVKDQDSEITGLTAAVNGGTAQAVGGSATLEGALSTNGSLSVQFTVTWPSASLADGSVTMASYTVVNLDKILRQAKGAKEISDWGAYLWTIVPFAIYQSQEAVFIQETAGNWFQISFDVLPVSRGGTGLSSMTANRYLKTTENGAVGLLSKEQVIEDLGSLRMQTGSYTGTGDNRTLTLPLEPKLLAIWSSSGPTYDYNSKTMEDNPILLGNGAASGELYTGSTSGGTTTYSNTASLSGATLTFSRNASSSVTNPATKYGNRSGVTYHWLAIY